ncbi:Protein of unknown function DUF262 [Desulfosporosinus acidiphilus SJ4]|uniref:GmrSD restriction endonucleases N-terminal domain-containing protein n=1 Tax=Desulfosporosinus acidiphilus (strain DSM 22704 / JCM 16185 / SJ4) TaxID=646529 RepID=I4DC79_DESAJ|nr:DUF262 domain-containing protein [Desulfosporosinus acidiphilus]AFM43403.1 Protein of unknown function DUF262 [Desulfosporosinus acidiphilus SJ4]
MDDVIVKTEGIDLIKAVEQKIDKVRTKSLDLSFNEILDMYKDQELIIDPEYQRLFRWSEASESRFIESLILEMPVPPIFVIERSEGVYELIDGLQRVSSYLHFRGKHPLRKNSDDTFEFLKLTDCDIVPELNGYGYEDLPKALEIRLKRNFIRVEVLRKETDQRLRYYMFKRLNTGGEDLSEQEIRNCTIKLLDDTFNKFLIKCSLNEDFKECIENLPEEKLEQKQDQELVLRFFTFKNYRHKYVHDVKDFMTEYMESVSDPEDTANVFDYEKEYAIFEKTFKVLKETLGSNIFSGTNSRGTLVSRFLSYHYEAFTLGIQPYLSKIDLSSKTTMEKLTRIFTEIKQDSQFKRITTGGGKNYSKPLDERINFVQTKVGEGL